MAQRLLTQDPNRRISLEVVLTNTWLNEMDSQCHFVPTTQDVLTQSANGSTRDEARLRDGTPSSGHPGSRGGGSTALAGGPLPIGPTPMELPQPLIIPVEGNVRDLVLKRRSPRIGNLVKKKTNLYWLYRSGLDRGTPPP